MAELDEEARRDRQAIEEVLGYSVEAEDWPDDALALGQRVRVIKDADWDGPWQREFLGTIEASLPPTLIKHELARPGEYEYFVRFDQDELDCDGQGPYRKACIWGRYLQVES